MKFVKLTLNDTKPIFVNLDLVSDMFSHGCHTVLTFCKEDYFLTIKETPEQILLLAKENV